MTEYRVVDKSESSIATMTPTARQRRLTLVLAAIVLIATTIIAPFGAIQLRRIDGFIPATESAIIITDFLTAVLLFSQSRIIGSRGLLLLASGYLFSALVVLPHLLTFPGAFAPSGLLGAGLSTTAWLFIFWHLGLPISVIGYALIDERRALSPSAIYFSVMFVICFACLLTWIVVVHDDVLPALFVDQIGFTAWANRVTSMDFVISLVALVVLWRRQKSVLDLWLIVSVCALVAELAITTFVITSRFSLGFYTQRIFSLGASTIVLSALLAEAVEIQGDNIAVAVEDSGPGIDKDQLGDIFTAFVTTKPHGMGLGLAISRMIIDYHGGKLTAASDSKCGGDVISFRPANCRSSLRLKAIV